MSRLWRFRSPSTNLRINVHNCDDLVSADDLPIVIQEVAKYLCHIKARLRGAREGLNACPQDEITHLEHRRRWIGELHQRLVQRHAEVRRQEKESRFQRWQEVERRYPFARYFQRVVRSETSPEQYQRWIDQAKAQQLQDSAHVYPSLASPQ